MVLGELCALHIGQVLTQVAVHSGVELDLL